MNTVIAGPAGDLEAIFQPAADTNRAALLCHPHPQYGGSMHDGVLGIAADVLDAQNVAHLRFNFRGIGQSAGQFDQGQGEQDDLASAWDYLARQGDWQELLLLGYSFGAAMAWAAQHRCAGLTRLILVAPPTAAMPFETGATSREGVVPCHVVVGEQDDFCDLTRLPPGAQPNLIDGADHFFSGRAAHLHGALADLC